MDVIMPKMGESVSEGTIIKWHKKEGDKVSRDEIIFEISTDKVDTEIPSPADGILQQIKVPEGETVEVGTVVAVINENGGSGGASSEKIVESPKQTPAPMPVSEPVKSREVETKIEEPVVQEKVNAPAVSSGDDVIDIAMPKMGESVMEGTILKWHKKVGEKVQKDETIFEISTDKVDTEVPSPAEGTIAEILVAEQETVEVGTIVARLATGTGTLTMKTEKPELPKPEKRTEVRQEQPQQMHDV
ncbi:MAG TPA: biotin/lipoyl-containing protein, partial [Ignavibacteriaceae bacterium]